MLGLFLSAAAVLRAAIPYNSATVTRVENQVKYGQVKGSHSETRLANPQDVVKASDFLLSEKDSRAELQYTDGTVVRIGQNTVFTFDANTRTLTLQKGTFVAHIPKGSGGATVKTPSLTAAITGTTVKVSETRIAVVEGSIKIQPDGPIVRAGQYAEVAADGTVTVYEYADLYAGKLMTWNGALAGPVEEPLTVGTVYTVTLDETVSDALNNPDAVISRTKLKLPKGDKPNSKKISFEAY